MVISTFNARKLLALRLARGWKHQRMVFGLHDLGFDIVPGTLRNWERGIHAPNGAALPYLVKIFELQRIDELFTKDDEALNA